MYTDSTDLPGTLLIWTLDHAPWMSGIEGYIHYDEMLMDLLTNKKE